MTATYDSAPERSAPPAPEDILPPELKLEAVDDPTTGEANLIDHGMRDHAARLGVPIDREPLALFLRDDDGDVYAGLLSYWHSAHGACILQQIWVHEELRGQGIGRLLMGRLEETMIARGCRLIHMDIMDFQARDFFERLGYTIIGSVAYPVSGRVRLFLSKDL